MVQNHGILFNEKPTNPMKNFQLKKITQLSRLKTSIGIIIANLSGKAMRELQIFFYVV